MKKHQRGLQTIFNPLQTAGTNDHEVSPFFHNKLLPAQQQLCLW